jgi:DNA polymerase III delta subunit
MIYLLHGNNFTKTKAKLRDIIALQMKKNLDATYFKLNSDNWTEEGFNELIQSRGLFQSKFIVVLDGLLSQKESNEVVLEALKVLKDSENIFIIVEENLTKEVLHKIEKHAEKTQEFSQPKKEKSDAKEFNVFTLTDALGARDKKHLWVLYQKAIFSGMAPEEIHRLFFWQVKAMLSANASKGAGESGLNPYVYKKSLGFSKNFTKKELNLLSSNLVSLYHDARRGITDFDIALERFVLGI